MFIKLHPKDKVAIVASEGGLGAGADFDGGLVVREPIPQAHKVALVDLPVGGAVVRYGVTIGYALRDLPAGSWVSG